MENAIKSHSIYDYPIGFSKQKMNTGGLPLPGSVLSWWAPIQTTADPAELLRPDEIGLAWTIRSGCLLSAIEQSCQVATF